MGGIQDPWEMGLHCLAPAQAAPTHLSPSRSSLRVPFIASSLQML